MADDRGTLRFTDTPDMKQIVTEHVWLRDAALAAGGRLRLPLCEEDRPDLDRTSVTLHLEQDGDQTFLVIEAIHADEMDAYLERMRNSGRRIEVTGGV